MPAADGHLMPLGGGREPPVLRDPEHFAVLVFAASSGRSRDPGWGSLRACKETPSSIWKVLGSPARTLKIHKAQSRRNVGLSKSPDHPKDKHSGGAGRAVSKVDSLSQQQTCVISRAIEKLLKWGWGLLANYCW